MSLLRYLSDVWKGYLRATDQTAPLIAPPENPLGETLRAYGCGDYNGAWEAARYIAVTGQPPSDEKDFFCGAMLLAGGHWDESEAALRRYLQQAEDPTARAAALGLLGEIQIERCRYDEAEEVLFQANHLAPEQSSPLRGLALVALRQPDADFAKALQFAHEAVQKDRGLQGKPQPRHQTDIETGEEAERAASAIYSIQPKRPEPVTLKPELPSVAFRSASGIAESLALLAWSTAAAGDGRERVERIVVEALALAKGKGVPVRGEVHFYSGCAYAEIDERVKSVRQFTLGGSLDFNGRWGQAAKNLLVPESKPEPRLVKPRL